MPINFSESWNRFAHNNVVGDPSKPRSSSFSKQQATMPDIDDYKLNKIFTTVPASLNAEEQALLREVKSTRTTPRDPRFPAFNQAGHCWNRYNEWLVCLKQTKGDEDGCKPMRYLATNICPTIWTEKWDEEREEGTFAGVKLD